MITEHAIQFGLNRSLVGIITRGDDWQQGPACILINAGLTPKSGPFRLYTRLARQLAEAGFCCLRFDLDSLGDSGSVYNDKPLEERTHLQITEAIALLRAQPGVKRIYLGGLCSGAEAALRSAETDPHIAGAFMIDPFAIGTSRAKLRSFCYRLYRRLLRSLGLYQPGTPSQTELVDYKYIEYAEAHRLLAKMLARRAYLHFIYTASVNESFNHPGQLQLAFSDLPIAGNVRVDYLGDVSHTPVLAYQLEKMLKAIVEPLLAREKNLATSDAT
jgi:dienelactone hydrolase